MAVIDRLSPKQSYAAYYRRVQQLAQQPKVRVSGLVSLTLLTVAFFGVFAILPTFKTIARLKKEIKESETIRVELQKKIAAMDKAQSVYLQASEDMSMVEQLLPSQVEFERLAWQVQWLADKYQVDINSGGYGEFPVKGRVGVEEETGFVEMDLMITGGYNNVRVFLEELTNIDRLVVLEEARINNKAGQTTGVVNANVEAKAYYLPKL